MATLVVVDILLVRRRAMLRVKTARKLRRVKRSLSNCMAKPYNE
jgi:hypothetical protein